MTIREIISPLCVAFACFAATFTCTALCITTFSQVQSGLYKDIDGEATKESEQKAAALRPLQAAIISVATVVGLGASLLRAVGPSPSPQSGDLDLLKWMLPALWVSRTPLSGLAWRMSVSIF